MFLLYLHTYCFIILLYFFFIWQLWRHAVHYEEKKFKSIPIYIVKGNMYIYKSIYTMMYECL